MKLVVHTLISVLISTISAVSSADIDKPLRYCEGKIAQIITRDSDEGTEVKLYIDEALGGDDVNGISKEARIGGEGAYTDQQRTQVSMLLAAYMADKKVRLELHPNEDELKSFVSCIDFPRGVKVRFVEFNRDYD